MVDANAASLGPIVLEGRGVRLEPLASTHREGLRQAAADPRIWPWMPADLSRPGALEAWMDEALYASDRGTAYVFTVIDRATNRIVGSTRYMDIQAEHRGVEIGWTWYAPAVWGTSINPEAKWLLLKHAFEEWGALRVQLKTDHQNLRSQAAIKKLGARYEGTLLNHRIRPDGSLRHTVLFSILPDEWPAVEARLIARLGRDTP
jgi:RimJ/RimL family protein N-acetyltransferase